MKTRIFVLSAALSLTAACSNGNDSDNKKDTANTLNDTFPSRGAADTIGLDSNPPDATKIDSGNRTTN
jgi:hypothetical protein